MDDAEDMPTVIVIMVVVTEIGSVEGQNIVDTGLYFYLIIHMLTTMVMLETPLSKYTV
jgi:hypothetical protein